MKLKRAWIKKKTNYKTLKQKLDMQNISQINVLLEKYQK